MLHHKVFNITRQQDLWDLNSVFLQVFAGLGSKFRDFGPGIISSFSVQCQWRYLGFNTVFRTIHFWYQMFYQDVFKTNLINNKNTFTAQHLYFPFYWRLKSGVPLNHICFLSNVAFGFILIHFDEVELHFRLLWHGADVLYSMGKSLWVSLVHPFIMWKPWHTYAKWSLACRWLDVRKQNPLKKIKKIC